jgi:hypothetical protein
MSLPWPLKLVQVDKMTVKLYLVVYLTMNPPERAHAFQTNKTALTMLGIDRCMMLNTLGDQINLSAIVDGILGNWNRHFCHNWCKFANLAILSFYNNVGTQVNNTTTARNLAILLPVFNGAMTPCRKQHICFVHVQMNLDF